MLQYAYIFFEDKLVNIREYGRKHMRMTDIAYYICSNEIREISRIVNVANYHTNDIEKASLINTDNNNHYI